MKGLRFALMIIIFIILAGASEDSYLKNIKQLTFEGDNGEAYFSFDGKRLIYQSDKGYKCDRIWVINIDGSGKKMVSPQRGAHTCAFFFPDGKRILFSPTHELEGECPEQPLPSGKRYVWPLYQYDIYIANIDGSNLRKLTNNPEYDAESVVSPDGQKILFTFKRNGDMDIYIINSDGTNLKRLTHRFGYEIK